MTHPVITIVRRHIADAENTGGMRVGLPQARIDCSQLEALCRLAELADALHAELEQIKRGEFICRKCGLRKDAEHAKADF